MGSFNRDNRSGGNRFGKPSFSGKSFGGGERRFGNDRGDRKFGGGGFGKPQMHDATCSQCGKPCQVPFRPTGDREVFCSNCFKDKRDSGFSKGNGNSFGKPRYESKPHFEKRPDNGGADHDFLKQQLGALNKKLDILIETLSGTSVKVVAKAPTEQVEVKEKAKSAKTKPLGKKTVTKKKK